MTNQTKMLIITTDEDIIRQCTVNKKKNTHIINMDNNNRINLDFLTELTEPNLNNDQVSKRALDSTEHNQSKSVKTRKKSTDLICIICGDHAIGYNYGVISCASCKAFFHRNGNEDLKRFKCIGNHGQCLVDYKRSRKCYRCRLKRCLAMGMRKDLILTQEEIQRRKDAGRNRNISSIIKVSKSSSTSNSLSNIKSILPKSDGTDRLLININQDGEDDNNILGHENIDSNKIENILFKPLTVEDLAVIQSIQSSFLSVFDNECNEFTDRVILPNDISELICCLQFNNEIALRLIKFCRSIDHFENLDADDRFILIKYNLLALACILSCYRRKSTNESSSYREDQEEIVKRQIYMLCGQSDYMYEMFMNFAAYLTEVVQHDEILLSLLLTIFLFSKGLSMNKNEPPLKDSLSAYRAESYYTKLLWNYMVNKHGETNTVEHFTKILTAIFRAQSGVMIFKEFLHTQMITFDAVDEIAPLMQTILHIS